MTSPHDTYNQQLESTYGLLVYPWVHSEQIELQNAFDPSPWLPTGHRDNCGRHFIDLFDAENRLGKDIGTQLLDRILAGVPAVAE